jgi:large repetitive protein
MPPFFNRGRKVTDKRNPAACSFQNDNKKTQIRLHRSTLFLGAAGLALVSTAAGAQTANIHNGGVSLDTSVVTSTTGSATTATTTVSNRGSNAADTQAYNTARFNFGYNVSNGGVWNNSSGVVTGGVQYKIFSSKQVIWVQPNNVNFGSSPQRLATYTIKLTRGVTGLTLSHGGFDNFDRVVIEARSNGVVVPMDASWIQNVNGIGANVLDVDDLGDQIQVESTSDAVGTSSANVTLNSFQIVVPAGQLIDELVFVTGKRGTETSNVTLGFFDFDWDPFVIDATPGSATGINGITGQNAVLNVLDGDTLNDPNTAPTDPANTSNVTVALAPGSSLPAGLTLNPNGTVDVAPGTTAGVKTFDYQICETANITNCDTATITITVATPAIAAANDAIGPVVSAAGGTPNVNVLTNDTFNGAAATTATVTVAAVGTVPSGLTLNADGTVTVAPGTPASPPGSPYVIAYRICDRVNTSNCADAQITVTVVASPILAEDDSAGPILGLTGGQDVINAFANDTLNGNAFAVADIIATVTAPATSIGGAPVPVLDPATGLVDVPAGTPAGNYTIGYQICERVNPTNCESANISIQVTAAAIATDPDSVGGIVGAFGADNVLNVLDGDTLNGAAVTPATVTTTVVTPATSIGGAPVPVLDTATGQVSVPVGTPAGSYQIQYQICERLNPSNCSINTATIVVVPTPIVADNDSVGGIVSAVGGTNVLNVLDGDTLDNPATPAVEAATLSNVTLRQVATSNPGVTLDPQTGQISVAAGTAPGTYNVDYEICEILNPTNCTTARATVTVVPNPIAADPDSVGGINGATGATDVLNVLDGDTLNGVAVTPATVTTTVVTPATSIGGAPVPVLGADGLVDVPAGTPAGTYTIEYQICETANPSNCTTNTATITVVPSPIVATNDSSANVISATGGNNVVNAFTGDTINGQPATPANATLSLAPGVTLPAGLSFDPTTGNVSVAPGTAPANYSFNYQICETLNPSNCRTATITVPVIANAIAADPDSVGGINGATGANDVLNVLDGDTLNGVAVTPATVTTTVVTPATSIGGAPVPVLGADGLVDVPAGTPAGTYTIGYQICETANPTNCTTNTATITVVPSPIVATNDSAPNVTSGTGGNNVVNAFTGDTINGQPATPANAILSLAPGVTLPAGLSFDPTTGNVSVTPGTAPANYSFNYQICERLNPTNCQTATITIPVIANAIAADPDSVGGINGATGATDVLNVLDGDTLNGVAVTPATVTTTVVTPATSIGGAPVPVLGADGLVDVPAGTPAGTYTIEYQICETANPSNCTTNTATVTVVPSPIVATNDFAPPVNGIPGGTAVANAFSGDTINGVPATPSNAILSVRAGTTVPAVLTFNTATGSVDVAPGTPAGTYIIDYTICERLNPTNCADARITVGVLPAGIIATNDSATGINGTTGASNVVNAFTGDTIGSQPATPANATVALAPGATLPVGLIFDTATGNVSVAPGTAAGNYSFNYQLCEKLNPTNCRIATISVDVVAAPIVATNDSAANVISATGGNNVVNAFTGDTINGQPATPANATLSLAPGVTLPNGLSFDPLTGNVSVAPGTAPANYSFNYQICETLNPSNCRTATITVPVIANAIAADPDSVGGINGATGANDVLNVLDGDTLNGVAVTPATVTTAVVTPATPINGGPVPVLGTDGLVDVPAGTPAGTYTIGYRICEIGNASNCADATATITVVPSPIVATNDSSANVISATGGNNVVNAFTGDTINGQSATPANATLSLAPGVVLPNGISFDPLTGNVSVAPGTAPGNYSFNYQICETLNPTNCRTATITIPVVATPIAATADTPPAVNGLVGDPNVGNAFANDTLNGQPVDPAAITARVTTPAANSGVVLDPVTGTVSVAPGTPAGTYTISYEICERANPTNCATSIVTVVVEAPVIAASPDAPPSVIGSAGNPNVVNAFANDTLNGQPVDPAAITARVTTPAANLGVLLDPVTGNVSVAPGTPAGTYTISYEICDRLNPTNCATSTVTVVVTAAPIAAANDAPPAVDGRAGNPNMGNVFGNDTLNGQPVSPATVALTVTTPASNPGVVLDPATGNISVAPGTPAGTYNITYQICEILNPTNCATATVAVVVNASPIAATADAPAPVNGTPGGNDIINALANDTLGGQPVTIADVVIRVTTPASNPGVVLDPATGLVDVAPGTPAGTYTIGYEICERLNPTNCATSTVTVVVTAAPIAATPDAPPAVNGATGNPNVVNAFTNDTLNGQPVDPAAIVGRVTTPASNPGVVLDPATGNVSVAPGTPAGTYTIAYEICERLNPTNCATSTVTVVVEAPAIAAAPDAPPAVNGFVGNPNVVNAFTNDTLNGQPVNPAAITARVTTPASNPGVVLDPATGIVSVASGTPAGTYTIAYEICERLNPANCATSTVTVVVQPAPIVATADTPTPVGAGVAVPNAVNAFANDTLNGQPVNPAAIIATVLTPASNPGVVLDPATGNVSVAADVPVGTYTITYQICERLNPTNCSTSTVTVVVTPPFGSISGTVYTDVNGNRVPDAGDIRQANWVVEVLNASGAVVGTAITDANGFYQVDNLMSGGVFDIRFRNPENNVVYDVIENVTVAGGSTVLNQNQPIDPSGVLYNSITRAPIANASVTLTDTRGASLPAVCFVDPSQRIQTTGVSGAYRFDVIPGAAPECPTAETQYRISITAPAGFSVPSTVLLPETGAFDPTGRTGPVRIQNQNGAPTGTEPTTHYFDFRLASGDPDIINNHIPIDPFLTRTPLVVTKTSTKRNVSVGDLVPYEITVRNTEGAQRAGVNVVDILPPGFKYVLGTASIDGRLQEPEQTDRQLVWRGQVIPANGSVKYNLVMVVGAGVTNGEKVNTGLAQNGLTNADISNRGTAVVTITPSAIFDCSELIGKVYEDLNSNGYQDEGERGLPAVRLVTVNGQQITTDEFGRYHIACAAVPDARIGSNFVLKVDPRTLPPGYRLTQDNPQSIRLTRGKMGELNFGAAATDRTEIKLTAAAFVPGTGRLKPEYQSQVDAMLAKLTADRPAILLTYTMGASERMQDAEASLKALAASITASIKTADAKSGVALETRIVRAGQAK